MEAFTLLKYWRGAAGLRVLSPSTTTTTTILTAADVDYDADDDGPFFDIEFTLPNDAKDGTHNHHNEEHEEFKLVHDDDDDDDDVDNDDDDVDPSSLQPNPKPHHLNSSFFKSTTKFFKSSEKQRFSKEAMQKYLKMVKPLYVKVSRRYSDKLSHSSNLHEKGTPLAERTQKKHDPVKEDSSTNNGVQKVTAGLRVVCKHLGKSRSASSAVAAAPPLLSSKRRDDSLLQQQDGIQGAILHCKSSFNASIECEIPPQLPRCVSDPLHEK
ncbi:unnamed protein product [Lupinus luteus]|uniref:Membrane-associated kinase regulator 2 n=1 Tax=Lupinus luteus TaxID=3873 RepID=A0AAV1WYW2_LUPLU